ncbi:precorrin-2 dehydrogenase/sirohydrochlorin ferrochelatase family protein [Mucisphaera calidilacus]|uniref:precorrin-2 dehydrogenase n=1 Tax=Mucisphaera calidilacus TaxID=2527982 RepID=A0A518BZ78_9BACT|nr:bifunctional precorrin-2 dehydrogenase/sirohydrochlorin ferrochelatase [Mucisphaera calidilacus]QDU72276.1 Precorrin-2 dehydrogenase [Mucisphaera calidilacus]
MGCIAVQWDVAGRNCLVVGAGRTGRRRAGVLCRAGARVTVVAPDADEVDFPAGVVLERREAVAGDLVGRDLVVLATDDAEVQASLSKKAAEFGVLVNRVDDGESGDITFLATRSAGVLTVAVSTGGASAAASGVIAEEALSAVAGEWGGLLALVAGERARIQSSMEAGAARESLLRRLVDERSRAAARSGEAALRAHWRGLWEASIAGRDGEVSA